jgi:hypothetical protein
MTVTGAGVDSVTASSGVVARVARGDFAQGRRLLIMGNVSPGVVVSVWVRDVTSQPGWDVEAAAQRTSYALVPDTLIRVTLAP